jgi:hypothetical protein
VRLLRWLELAAGGMTEMRGFPRWIELGHQLANSDAGRQRCRPHAFAAYFTFWVETETA